MKTIIAALCCFMALMAYPKNGMYRKPIEFVTHNKVSATIYKPSCGRETADGTRVPRKNAGALRLIAVSWDLRHKYPFGTKVYIAGAGEHDGVYTVRDLMNKRWRNKIDILVNQSHRMCRYKNVSLSKLLEPEDMIAQM